MADYSQALEAIKAIKENIKDDRVWVIQRWAGWKRSEHGHPEVLYETISSYRLMTYDEMLKAQRALSKQYPGQVFEGYRRIPDGRVKPG